MPPANAKNPGSTVSDRARQSFVAANLFLKNQLWIWPVLAAVVLLTIGMWVRGTVEESQKNDLREDLTGILNADVEALDIWMKAQRSNATTAAEAVLVNRLSRELIALGSNDEIKAVELVQSPLLAEVRQAL